DVRRILSLVELHARAASKAIDLREERFHLQALRQLAAAFKHGGDLCARRAPEHHRVSLAVLSVGGIGSLPELIEPGSGDRPRLGVARSAHTRLLGAG